MTKPIEFTAKTNSSVKYTQDVCPDTFDDSQLPTDIHLVYYTVGDFKCVDAVRAYSDIFDDYFDKLKDIGTIDSIKSNAERSSQSYTARSNEANDF